MARPRANEVAGHERARLGVPIARAPQRYVDQSSTASKAEPTGGAAGAAAPAPAWRARGKSPMVSNESDQPNDRPGAAAATWRVLIGRPLRSGEASKERITPVEGLSALSLDALTSVAYGPEAIIVVLAVAGSGGLHDILPITIVIVLLLAVLVFSYRQVIDAYPGGGGAYAVSRANLGTRASLVAGASLIVDYTLTVAVSIAAGVGALTSAFPSLTSATVPICLGILAVITLLNLRGLGETARAFLLPTMVFIVGLLAIIVVGLIHPLALHDPQPGRSLLATHSLETVSVLLILKAFSAGCSALTGVEAIANGVPLFKEPRVVRAKRTELMLGVILGAMLLGLAVLASHWHIGPRSGQTVLSQIMADAVGRHWAYYVVSLTITLVLSLAANTSFGGLPVLASLLSRDDFLPHLFAQRGDRQVFANGIWALSILSAGLLIAVGGNTNSLIPLYAIGVFTGFTLAQTGLVVHWWRERPDKWRHRAAVNGLGATMTAIATVVFLFSKFLEGAWVVVVAVPTFVFLFARIHAYYVRAGHELGFGEFVVKPQAKHSLVIVPVTAVSRLTEHAISEALSLGEEVVAVTVVLDGGSEGDAHAESLQHEWGQWDPGVALTVLHTDYASVVDPLCAFIDERRAEDDRQIVVLIPVVIPDRIRYRILHNQIDLVLSAALRSRPDVVVARVQLPLGILAQEGESAEQAAAESTTAGDRGSHKS
jgi:amino acid transporter